MRRRQPAPPAHRACPCSCHTGYLAGRARVRRACPYTRSAAIQEGLAHAKVGRWRMLLGGQAPPWHPGWPACLVGRQPARR
eukprot:scaffold25778_cov129-Isochrysis_galbana.AAC.3